MSGATTTATDWFQALRRANDRFPILQIVALAALFIYGIATITGYASKPSLMSLFILASFLGIAAGGQTFVILIGGLDLSMPAVISAANIATAVLTAEGLSFPLIFIAVMIVAILIGCINGYISHRFDVPSLIVTLGVGAAIIGGALVWTQGRPAGGAPAWLSSFVSPVQETGPIPLPPVVVFWAVFALVLIGFLSRTPLGRRIYATGANERAARLALVDTRRVWMGAFAASAICGALTGMLLAGFTGQGQFGIGDPYLFLSIAAVVVGGTSLLGARGGYGRTVLGALILIQVSILLAGQGTAVTQIVTGAVIVAVVSIYGRETHVRYRV
jgi:ribose transport system permease protein